VFLFLGVFNLATLTISPVPWTDEIYYADLSMSLARHSGFVNTILPMDNPPFIYIYGPIYFFFQALLIKLFGLKIFLFRSVNFISSIGILWILHRYFRVNNLLILLLALSPLFIQNAHSGRMDLLATLFTLAGYIPFANKKEINWRRIFLTSIFFLLAFLTSPRVGFLFPGLYVFLFSEFKFNVKNIFLILIPPIAVITGLIGWSLITTGSPFGAYLPIFQSNIAQSSDLHLGVSFIRGHIDDLISIFFVFFGIFSYVKNRNRMVLTMLINFFLFSCCVKEVGPYGAMVLPFLVIGLAQIDFKNNYFNYSIAGAIILFTLIFLGKGIFLLASIPERNYTLIDNFIKTNIPIGEKVCSTNEYYYGLLKNRDFPMMVEFETKESTNFILKERPKYIFVNMQYYKSGKLDFIFNKIRYKNIGQINEKNLFGNIPYLKTMLAQLNFNQGMNGVLLEKVK
jgi:hypothetical protein